MQKIIKITTLILIVFILMIFYFSLNISSNYDTENLVGNKLNKIKLESFDNNFSLTNKDFEKSGLGNSKSPPTNPIIIETNIFFSLSDFV